MTTSFARIRIIADDVWHSSFVDEGALRLADAEVITGVSAFVNFGGPSLPLHHFRQLGLELGMHFCISSGGPVGPADAIPSLVGPERLRFKSPTDLARTIGITNALATYVAEVVPGFEARDVESELANQLGAFFTFAGGSPDHLTVHHDIDVDESLRECLKKCSGPSAGRQNRLAAGELCGYLYAFVRADEPVEAYVRRVHQLLDEAVELSRAKGGIVEIACHPGWGDDSELDTFSVYRRERSIEVEAWTHRSVRERFSTLFHRAESVYMSQT